MKKVIVNLNDMNKIKLFVNAASTFMSDIDLVNGRYAVDAKSIMGVFSLDLSKPIEAVIYSEDKEELDRFEEVMKIFLSSTHSKIKQIIKK